TGSGPLGDRLRFDGQRLRQVTISNPSHPDPLSSGGTLATQPSGIVRFAPGLRSPYSTQFSLGVEQQLAKGLTATANYINTRGIKLFRSRNINAPRPPYIQRPDPNVGVLRQIESTARSQAHALDDAGQARAFLQWDDSIYAGSRLQQCRRHRFASGRQL
ncbi:MAG: hypothetical protein ACR2L2_18445, partial [Acidobacteriota bacterium]